MSTPPSTDPPCVDCDALADTTPPPDSTPAEALAFAEQRRRDAVAHVQAVHSDLNASRRSSWSTIEDLHRMIRDRDRVIAARPLPPRTTSRGTQSDIIPGAETGSAGSTTPITPAEPRTSDPGPQTTPVETRDVGVQTTLTIGPQLRLPPPLRDALQGGDGDSGPDLTHLLDAFDAFLNIADEAQDELSDLQLVYARVRREADRVGMEAEDLRVRLARSSEAVDRSQALVNAEARRAGEAIHRVGVLDSQVGVLEGAVLDQERRIRTTQSENALLRNRVDDFQAERDTLAAVLGRRRARTRVVAQPVRPIGETGAIRPEDLPALGSGDSVGGRAPSVASLDPGSGSAVGSAHVIQLDQAVTDLAVLLTQLIQNQALPVPSVFASMPDFERRLAAVKATTRSVAGFRETRALGAPPPVTTRTRSGSPVLAGSLAGEPEKRPSSTADPALGASTPSAKRRRLDEPASTAGGSSDTLPEPDAEAGDESDVSYRGASPVPSDDEAADDDSATLPTAGATGSDLPSPVAKQSASSPPPQLPSTVDPTPPPSSLPGSVPVSTPPGTTQTDLTPPPPPLAGSTQASTPPGTTQANPVPPSPSQTGSALTVASSYQTIWYGGDNFTRADYDTMLAGLPIEDRFDRYWAHLALGVLVLRQSPTSEERRQGLPAEIPSPILRVLMPFALRLYPEKLQVIEGPVIPSDANYRRLVREVEDARPWQTMIDNWPDPLSFSVDSVGLAPLLRRAREFVAEVAHGLWYRTHHFRYSDFLPPDSALRQEAADLDLRIKNLWSHRTRDSSRFLTEVLRALADGMITPGIVLDPVFLVLPSATTTYPWIPDFSPGAPGLAQQLASLDAADPWRLYYVESPRNHPTFRYGLNGDIELHLDPDNNPPDRQVLRRHGLPSAITVLEGMIRRSGPARSASARRDRLALRLLGWNPPGSTGAGAEADGSDSGGSD